MPYPASRLQPARDASAAVRLARALARTSKRCPRCGQVLPCSAFYPTPTRGRDGLSGYCRICTAGIVRERYRRRQGWLPGLADAAGAADGLAVKKRAADRRLTEPSVPDLPLPDFSAGLCSTLPSQSRAWWTSDVRAEQRAAALACAGCPVLAECEAWALSVSEFFTGTGTVWAGMTPAQLRRARRKLIEDVAEAVR